MDEQTADQGDAGAIMVKPSTTFLTACAALNWIAFQRAEDGDLTGRLSLWREFGYEPCLPPAVGGWDYVVAEAANVLQPEHHALMEGWTARFGQEPKDLQAARDAAARFCAERNWPAINLHVYSIGRREMWSQRQHQLWDARDKLVAALADELLTAHAARADASAASGRMGIPVEIPWQFFLARNAVVFPSGEITADGDPGYLDAKFRSTEILALWPVPKTRPPTLHDRSLLNLPSEAAAAWMLANVTKYVANQRDDRVKECMAALGIRKKPAIAGWMALPDTIRGPSRRSK